MLINSIGYNSVLFILLAFLTSFFPISPVQTCQKILKIFVVLCYTDYRFYQRILKNSWIFIEKNRDIWNTKHFQNSIVYYLLFYILVFLTSFSLFYLPIVIKEFLKFLCFLLYGSENLSKHSVKLWFFFSENLIYLKSKISPKFHYLLFLYYFFSIFDIFFILFHLSKLVKTLLNFLFYFIGTIRDFINEFWKFLKGLLKKYTYVKYFWF